MKVYFYTCLEKVSYLGRPYLHQNLNEPFKEKIERIHHNADLLIIDFGLESSNYRQWFLSWFSLTK